MRLKFKNIKTNIFLVATIILIAASNSFAQVKIERMAVGPLNRLIVFFNEFPVKYKSELADDKKKITVTVSNVQVLESARFLKSTGAITEAYAGPEKLNAVVSVILAQAGGYSITEAPYSKALIIETFNWNNLAPGEEAYRTALLGLEDKIIQTSKSDLLNSVKSGYVNSATVLGILLMQEGKINSALKNLLYAESKGSNLPDLYGAISQIYSIKGDNVKTRKYSDLFLQKTGLKALVNLNLPEAIEKDTNCTEPVAHLLLAKLPGDTNSGKSEDPNARFNKLFTDTTKKADAPQGILSLYSDLFTMIGACLLALILLIVYLYFKWRNKQITEVAKTPVSNATKAKKKGFADSLKEAKAEVTPKKAAKKTTIAEKVYKNNSGTIIDKTISEDELIIDTKNSDKVSRNVKANDEFIPKPEIDKNDKIVQILESLKSIKENKEEKSEDRQLETVYSDEMKPKPKPMSAKVELARHLAQEQQRIKKENIESLNANRFMPDQEQLSEVSKRLGIEKGSLETKKALDNISNDSAKLSKLEEKFSALKNTK